MDCKMGKVSSLIPKKEESNNELEQTRGSNDSSSKSQTNRMESKHAESHKSTQNARKVKRRFGPSILQQKIQERRNPLAWRFAKRTEKLQQTAMRMEEQLIELRENRMNMMTEFKRTLGSELFEIKKSLDNQVYYLQSISSCLEELAIQEAGECRNENQNV